MEVSFWAIVAVGAVLLVPGAAAYEGQRGDSDLDGARFGPKRRDLGGGQKEAGLWIGQGNQQDVHSGHALFADADRLDRIQGDSLSEIAKVAGRCDPQDRRAAIAEA